LSPPTLAGCGAIALWAFLAVLSRHAAGVPPFALVALCFTVSAAAGLGWLAIRGRLGEIRQPPLAWLHGVSGLFGYHALYFAALALAPAAEANLLNYAWPLMIVLLSAALLGLRLTRWHAVGIALATLGCALLLANGARFTAQAAAGYGLALASAVTWALYSVLARRLSGVPTGALAGFCAATAVLAALCHATFEPPASLDARTWVAVVLMGLGPLGGAFFLWDTGMKRGDPRLLGTLAYATPVLSTGLLIAGGFAPLTLFTIAAAVLVAAGGCVAGFARGNTANTRTDTSAPRCSPLAPPLHPSPPSAL
jgi:drug/metabolite transporter (DMT)-like permease